MGRWVWGMEHRYVKQVCAADEIQYMGLTVHAKCTTRIIAGVPHENGGSVTTVEGDPDAWSIPPQPPGATHLQPASSSRQASVRHLTAAAS